MKAPEVVRARTHALLWFVLANIAIAIVLGHGFVAPVAEQANGLGRLFVHVALYGQIGLVSLVVAVPLLATALLPQGRSLILVLGPLLFTGVHVFIYLDRIVYSMFRFHINGLAYNVLTTPGGFASMRLGRADVVLFVGACLVGLAFQYALLRLLLRSYEAEPAGARSPVPRWGAVVAVVLALGATDRAIYATADLRGSTAITRLARAIPLYQPMTIKRLASRYTDIDVYAGPRVPLAGGATALNYPARPLAFEQPADKPNIVWVVLDSWRFDMFNELVTPNIWKFSRRALVFENHLATGNATRFGIFGMFYGLHGSYWHHMLSEQRGPVLISRLRELGYTFKVITPSPLTFPEFRRTAFVDIRSSLVDDLPGEALLDRHVQTVETFERFVAAEASARPFFAFMFFDSTHAPYDFPPEHAPFRPYADEVSYGDMGLVERRDLIVNRYQNAMHYLDHLTARVIAALDGAGLLGETVVVITGDHGEEFNEHGYWGHNSAFTPQQIHVPLVVYRPDQPPGTASWVTSHQDLAPTFMEILGVRSPASDYSNGQSLFNPQRDVRVVACGWDECSWIQEDGHIIFGTQTHRAWGLEVLDREYKPHADGDAILAKRSSELVSLASDLRAFLK